MPRFGSVSKLQMVLHGVGSFAWCKDLVVAVPEMALNFPYVAENWQSLAAISEAVAWSSLYETQVSYEFDLMTIFTLLQEGPVPSIPSQAKVEGIVGKEVSDYIFSLVPSYDHNICRALPDLVDVSGDSTTLSDLGSELADRYGPRLVTGTSELLVKYIEADVFDLVSFLLLMIS